MKKEKALSLEEFIADYHQLIVHGTEFSTAEIEDLALAHITNCLDAHNTSLEYGLEEPQKQEWINMHHKSQYVYLDEFRVLGSRIKGTHTPQSDLNIVFAYEGDLKEKELFNLLNQEPLEITGLNNSKIVGVIRPINQDETGTLDKYLKERF